MATVYRPAVTRGFTRAKRIVCNSRQSIRDMKRAAHRAYRRTFKQALSVGDYDYWPKPRATDWDTA